MSSERTPVRIAIVDESAAFVAAAAAYIAALPGYVLAATAETADVLLLDLGRAPARGLEYCAASARRRAPRRSWR